MHHFIMPDFYNYGKILPLGNGIEINIDNFITAFYEDKKNGLTIDDIKFGNFQLNKIESEVIPILRQLRLDGFRNITLEGDKFPNKFIEITLKGFEKVST